MPNTDLNGCDAVLVQNVDFYTANEELRSAALSSISESSYERLTAGGGGGLNFFDWFDVEAECSSFDERRREYLNSQESYLEQRAAVAYLHRFTTPKQQDVWLECKRLTATTSGPGILCWVRSQDLTTVTIEFQWNQMGNGVPTVTSELLGGRPVNDANVPDGQAFPPGFQIAEGRFRRSFRRDAGTQFVLNVNVTINGTVFTDGVVVPPWVTETIEATAGKSVKIIRGEASGFYYPTDHAMWAGTDSRYDTRGIVFPRGTFSKPPEVSVSIKHFDIRRYDGPRLRIGVQDITKNGCTIWFHTWSETDVAGVIAEWIAFGY